jgi:hypothetical protein
MCRWNKIIICSLILGLTLQAKPEYQFTPEGSDHPGSYGPRSTEMQEFNEDKMRGLTEEKLTKMSFGDPLLRYAYFIIFSRHLREPDTLNSEEVVVLKDMRRRGDLITPLLLELARQNQETIFESALLDKIAEVGNIDLNPYLEYARSLLQERTQTMNASLARCASMLLANHGSKQDLVLLEQVISERSYTAPGVTESLEFFKQRLERLERAKQATRPIQRDKPSANIAAVNSAAAEAVKQPVANISGNALTSSWMIWVVAGIVISGLVWLLLKIRHERK